MMTIKNKTRPRNPQHRVSTAVILSAGKGSRLNETDMPKPLVPVVGVPLVGRVLAVAAKAGIRRFVIVVGFQADFLREQIPHLIPSGCEFVFVDNPFFEKPNGISLLAATQTLQEPFVLLMSDHIFSADRLEKAMDHFNTTDRCLLVVEDKHQFDGDLDDATRVSVKQGKVFDIGKGLGNYDAIDTGMFILHPKEVSEALKAAGPAPSISDGMRILSSVEKLDALYIHLGYWQDVDTINDVAVAEQKLFRSLTKTTDGFLAQLINRRVSLFLSKRLWGLGVTPHMVTSFTLFLGIMAGIAFAQGSSIGWGLLGALLFQLHSIIDGVDGELARLLHKDSRFGFWLDVSADNIVHMVIFGGIAWGQKVSHVQGPWITLGLLSILGVAASFTVMAPLLDPVKQKSRWKQEPSILKKLVDNLSRRDFTYLLFPLAVLGWLGEFLWVAAIGTWLFTLAVIFLRVKARKP